ncbi:MAG: LemA family protein [Bilifractor sp.]|jgi:LemA protein
MVLIIILIVVAVIVIWFLSTYNSFVRARNNVEEGYSTMDVYLKKRYDLIPNLVETVKGYARHEKETLQSVISARSSAMNAGNIEERARSESQLSQCLKTLFAVAESYPELKANQNFLDLQGQLTSVEQDIANSRKYYNAVVKKYNNLCELFPSNLVAGIFHFERRPMFEVTNEEERQNVKVDFGA